MSLHQPQCGQQKHCLLTLRASSADELKHGIRMQQECVWLRAGCSKGSPTIYGEQWKHPIQSHSPLSGTARVDWMQIRKMTSLSLRTLKHSSHTEGGSHANSSFEQESLFFLGTA